MLLAGSALLCLSACAQQPIKVAAAAPVIVTKTVYAPVPEYLLESCAPSTPESVALATNGSLLAAYQTDATALAVCAAQVQAIRALFQSNIKP